MNSSSILAACAFGAFAWSIWLLSRLRKKKRAMARMKVAKGVVRVMKTHKTGYTSTGTPRWRTEVDVEFSVNGQTYRCTDLYLFGGNGHVSDVGTKFDFPEGQGVGVYYDPENPRLNAMVFNGPSYFMTILAACLGILFAVYAACIGT